MDNGSKTIRLSFVLAIVFALSTAVAVAGFIWAFIERDHFRHDTDAIVAEAVDVAREEQRQASEEEFLEREKLPNRTFSGPADFGRVSFDYPKTWSAFNYKNDTNNYSVYFYPLMVPPLEADTAFALVVSVTNQSYDSVLKSYDNLVSSGDVVVTPIRTAKDDFAGMRLDGKIYREFTGSVVIFKVRDKTLTIQVESERFKNDFNRTILPSLTFAP